MSIIRCEKHDRTWDSDKLEECPLCESPPLAYKDGEIAALRIAELRERAESAERTVERLRTLAKEASQLLREIPANAPNTLGMRAYDLATMLECAAFAEAGPTHTDHPLRHFDRTCPGCIAEAGAGPSAMASPLNPAAAWPFPKKP